MPWTNCRNCESHSVRDIDANDPSLVGELNWIADSWLKHVVWSNRCGGSHPRPQRHDIIVYTKILSRGQLSLIRLWFFLFFLERREMMRHLQVATPTRVQRLQFWFVSYKGAWQIRPIHTYTSASAHGSMPAWKWNGSHAHQHQHLVLPPNSLITAHKPGPDSGSAFVHLVLETEDRVGVSPA